MHVREEQETPQKQKRGRGFASMSLEKRKEIAGKGGRAAHRLGKAHKWTHDEAVAAGKKGGAVTGKAYKRRRQAE